MPKKNKNEFSLYAKKNKIVEVCWVDAQAEESWEYIDGLDKAPMYIKTIGYELDKTEVDLIICRSLSSDKGLEGRFHIPLACIQETRKIR